MNLESLEIACTRVTDTWGYGPIDLVFEGHDHVHIEAVLHEAAHAASLGLTFPPRPETTALAVHALENDDSDSLLGKHARSATEEEARAWCVEWLLIQRLNLRFEWGDVVEGAAVQGVEDEQLARWKDAPGLADLAEQIYTWLEALVEDTSRVLLGYRGSGT